MKIINQLTLRYLKENKKRTILTILCIVVSVIMISCVGIAFYSGKDFYKHYIEKTIGDYHYSMVSNRQEVIDLIKNDKNIEEYYFSCTEFYKYNNQDETIDVKRGDSLYFEKYHIQDHLIAGKMPTNPYEIALSKEYLEKHDMHKNIGDTIDLYLSEEGQLETFQIVGLIHSFDSNTHYLNSFNALSYISFESPHNWYTIYVRDQDVSTHIFEHVSKIEKEIEKIEGVSNFSIHYNSSYLAIQDIFEEGSHSSFLIAYQLVAFILIIIIFISVFIIYQAFHLSTSDRIQYLGMLSSVGATPKQKKRSVYFEGFVLSLISIPLGILISFIGLAITFYFVSQLEMIKSLNLSLQPSLSLSYLLIVIALSLITIFISLYMPARKISKISVMDALKKNDEIKAKKLKNTIFTKKFNISWQIALKNYQRQGRRSRIIVFSLVVSMVAFISVFSFGQNLNRQLNKSYDYHNKDIYFNVAGHQQLIQDINHFLDQNDKVDSYYYLTKTMPCYMKIKTNYLSIHTENLIQKDGYYLGYLVGIDDKTFQQICKDNHVVYQENMLLAYNGRYENLEEQEKERYIKMDSDFIEELYYEDELYDENETIQRIDLKTFDSIELIKDAKYKSNYGNDIENYLIYIVPINYILNIEKSTYDSIEYNVFSKQHQQLTEELNEHDYRAYDYAASISQDRELYLIIQIFIYGFVCIMIFFTILNIMNMMSASIEKRQKELGMMLSVGMSYKDLQRMIFKESAVYGLKTLLYGIPISLLMEWNMFNMVKTDDMTFMPSLSAYMISFVVIMIVMLLTFKVALGRLRKQNIIETLKDDM